jgi:uncharacterized protein YjbI with pentapeptide repeats
MKINEQIKYPVDLGTWQLVNSDHQGKPHWMRPNYSDWNNDDNQPYAGGFGYAVFDYQGGGGGEKTFNWHIVWVGDGQVALLADYNQVYAWSDAGHLAPLVALTHGGGHDHQMANTSYDPNGRFTLVNLKSGHIAIQRNGLSMSFRYNEVSQEGDEQRKPIKMVKGVGDSESIYVVGSQFPILLLSKSAAGLSLAGQDLSAGHYIESVRDVDFTAANLNGANFSTLLDPNLAGCNFTGAQMSKAILKGCRNLNQAIWGSANLSNTDLSQVDRAGTAKINFDKASLQGASLSNGRPLAANFDYSQARFMGANLAGANLQNLNLRGADFTDASLVGANLKGADLTQANLHNANLQGAHLDGAILTNARLTNARLDNATLANTDLTGTHLENTKFRFCDLSSAVFSPAPIFGGSIYNRTSFFKAVNLPAARLGLNWSFLDLRGAHLTDIPRDLSGLKARRTLFPDRVKLSGVSFRQADFENARMYYADLADCDLSGARLDNSLLKGATLTRANLSNASMKGAWLIAEAAVHEPDKYEAAKAPGAFLLNTKLDGAHCDGVDFSGIHFLTNPALSIQPASAIGAFMNRVDFSEARIICVDFRGAQLAGSTFDNGVLLASRFPSAQITPTSDEVHSAPSMQKADLRGAQFADLTQNGTSNPANLDGLDLLGAIYSGKAGTCQIDYEDFYGKACSIEVHYGPTVPGSTTANTVCPDGKNGPCAWKMAAER